MSNCTFIGTEKVLRFRSLRGRGGVVEYICVKDIYMKNIQMEAMFYAVTFGTGGKRDTRPVLNEGTPVFRNMRFENIVYTGAKKSIFIRGLPETAIQNVTLANVTLPTDKGVELTWAKPTPKPNSRTGPQKSN